jgi:hypothetical protein
VPRAPVRKGRASDDNDIRRVCRESRLASCFEWDGDDQWVQDSKSNDGSARAQIQTNYGKVRWCANTHQAVSWYECTFDHSENTCVRWRMYEQHGTGGPSRNWTPWTRWHSTSTGDLC